MRSDFDWKAAIERVLRANPYCCLATPDAAAGAWANPVYYAYDDSPNFYFISMPATRHMRNIRGDGRIALAIYDSTQDTHGDIVGVQIEGTATVLTALTDIQHAFATYYSRVHPGEPTKSGKTPADFLGAEATWVFVRVTPTTFHYFDTKMFGETRQTVPDSVFPR